MSEDLASIGLQYDRWQDAVEAAIASGQLSVTGEVRGGQLIQFTDPSGACINILAVEPFATWAGFESTTDALGHVTMLTDVLAFCDVVTGDGEQVASVTANLAQGPLLVDENAQQWQQLAITALAVDTMVYPSADDFTTQKGGEIGMLVSHGAAVVLAGDGSRAPDAGATLTAEVRSAEYRTTALSGQRFIHCDIEAPFPMDLCLPDSPELPAPGSVVAGTVMLTAAVKMPAGCGSGSGGCGCGSGGCS
ncbi:hypothetical protein M0E87_05340 [Corynebacterium sp. CCM 9185]|uniref:Uncharacterized protein n=1 Tax=Corynebacterium marambiense TaxID=2765364 RepID=A0ABS0VV37_9CORY|nr:hypothetical protein [Corynebacterium marambiense]MBI9000646.1 hypothetical protein [Corynebacterium marambiense]MCK7663091.1 hypothetical protein [Corynebacterium marambiense]MCX7542705.1 hypothetical protein [Corynebacterium marambiense]